MLNGPCNLRGGGDPQNTQRVARTLARVMVLIILLE